MRPHDKVSPVRTVAPEKSHLAWDTISSVWDTCKLQVDAILAMNKPRRE
jgi:hypothetical protein